MTKYTILAILLGITLTYTARANDELVAAVICMEAGGEGGLGMQAVMNIIDNRARMDRKTYMQVVTAPKQFSCMNGVTMSMAIGRAKSRWPNQFPVALNMVKLARNGRLADVTNGATFYYANYIKRPRWARNMEETSKIGKHIFLRKYE